jgi:hypothetical protein
MIGKVVRSPNQSDSRWVKARDNLLMNNPMSDEKNK